MFQEFLLGCGYRSRNETPIHYLIVISLFSLQFDGIYVIWSKAGGLFRWDLIYWVLLWFPEVRSWWISQKTVYYSIGYELLMRLCVVNTDTRAFDQVDSMKRLRCFGRVEHGLAFFHLCRLFQDWKCYEVDGPKRRTSIENRICFFPFLASLWFLRNKKEMAFASICPISRCYTIGILRLNWSTYKIHRC